MAICCHPAVIRYLTVRDDNDDDDDLTVGRIHSSIGFDTRPGKMGGNVAAYMYTYA